MLTEDHTVTRRWDKPIGHAALMSIPRPTPSDEVEPPADPSELAQFHFEHPWRAGAIGGIAILGVGFARGLPWFVAVPVGIAIVLWTGLVWRPGGPGTRMRKYMLRRFPQREPGKSG